VVVVVDPDDVLPFAASFMLVWSNLVLSSFRPKKLATHIPPIFSISSLPPFFPSFTLVFTTIHHQILRHRHVPGRFLPDFSACLVIHKSRGNSGHT